MIPTLLWMISSFGNSTVEAGSAPAGWNGVSAALHILLPVAGLAALWGRKGVLDRLLLQLDQSCVAVYCPSFSTRDKLLKWASQRLPFTWSMQTRTLAGRVGELWKDGSLLCTLINSAIPGACPNPHRHWRKPPMHAQALAYKYFGLTPLFTEDDLSGELTVNLERNFIQYLQELQLAINKWQSGEDGHEFSSQYVVRGMGLCTGEQHRKTVFYIYSNIPTKKRNNVLMYIRGPYGTRGKATIPPFHSLKTISVVNVQQKKLETTQTLPAKNKEQKSFLETISLDFTSLITSEIKNVNCNIPIRIDMEIDRAKVTYIPRNNGMYEIILLCNGEFIQGCPYYVHITDNTSGIIDDLNRDDGTPKNMSKVITKNKVLSRFIDCVDEKLFVDDAEMKTLPNDKVPNINASSTKEKIVFRNTDKIISTRQKTEDLDIQTENKQKSKHQVAQITKEFELKLNENMKKNKYNNTLVSEISTFPTDENVNNVNSGNNIKDDNNFCSKTLAKYDCKTNTKKIASKYYKEESDEEKKGKVVKPDTESPEYETAAKEEIFKNIKNSCNTSPICLDQIAPEVEKETFKQLSIKEKRNIFAHTTKDNCLLSNEESEQGSKFNDLSELTVVNILNSLKQIQKERLHSLSITNSLPNISSFDNYPDSLFKVGKKYWEKKLACSSNNSSLLNLHKDRDKTVGVIKKKMLNKFNDSNNYKQFLKNDFYENVNTIEPKDEILCFNEIKQTKETKYYYKLQSLEERKMLLQKHYYVKKEIPLQNQLNIHDEQGKKVTFFTSISTKIKIFDKRPSHILDKSQDTKNEQKINSTRDIWKSQFKRAFKYFRSLEQNCNKAKTKKLVRRKSLNNF